MFSPAFKDPRADTSRGEYTRLPTGEKESSPTAAIKAIKHDYKSDGVKDNDVFTLPRQDWIALGCVMLASLVRLFHISQPTSVVFDEVHFGGFASKYLKGRFFMDVHPPLTKLLITLSGLIAGFDGNFDFKEIGKDYIEPNVPYVQMRLFPALCGILAIPCMFLTLKAYGCRTTSAVLGSAAILFDNALTTQSKLILLDAPLVLAVAFTALSWTCFSNLHEQGYKTAFTPRWWFWLTLTGLGLGLTVSSKWVGLFTIGWVGSLTALQLWLLLGEVQSVSIAKWFQHVGARAACLIGIPVTVYLVVFAIHFNVLRNPGEGDGFMSPEFQSTLQSKRMRDVQADIYYGSRVSIRHVNSQGGYLHSHPLMYKTGSKQQQVTLYPHKDTNNEFLIENEKQPVDSAGEPIAGVEAWDDIETEHIMDGKVIRLYHTATDRRIHSHDYRPPVTEADYQNEVSAYGYKGFEGDANDLFRVEIVKDMSEGELAKTQLMTIRTKFRLIHVMSGCALFSHKVKLPDWASEQQEVTCAKGGTIPNSIWYIESSVHPNSKSGEMVNYSKPGFFGKLWELHVTMWKINAGLVAAHNWDSRPESWPLLLRGINFWARQHRQVYLIGNPIVWWSSTAAILVYLAVKAVAVIRWQRNCGDYSSSNATFKRFDYEIGSTLLGWAFHYLPFFLMERQLFLHHYLPALYFAVLGFAQLSDFVFDRFDFVAGGFARLVNPLFGRLDSGAAGSAGLVDLVLSRVFLLGRDKRPLLGRLVAGLFIFVTIVSFKTYAPITFGDRWTKSECQRVKLLDGWDWDCKNFYDTYEEYDAALASLSAAAASSSDLPTSEAVAESIEVVSEHEQVAIGDIESPGSADDQKEVNVAPPHPDKDGAEPQTKKDTRGGDHQADDVPPTMDNAAESRGSDASPASEAKPATVE